MEALLRDAANQWMTNARLTQYQALLLEKDGLMFDKSWPLILLPCCWMMTLRAHPWLPGDVDVFQDMRPDLIDVPLTTTDANLYMDGSSFIQEGTRMWGDSGHRPQALPRDTSAQREQK